MTTQKIILDGGMGRELARIGAPFRQPEWSALALYEAPEQVRAVHSSFIAAGAEVITTNSYAVVPFHIGETRFQQDGARLAALAGTLAREAADQAAHSVRVAGSIPPALGSYHPELFEKQAAQQIHQVLISAQSPAVDLWLGETISSVAEAEAIAELLTSHPQPLWLSFTLQDEDDAAERDSVLRSGEPVSAAVEAAIKLGAEAILFNCSHPEVMRSAIRTAKAVLLAQNSPIAIGVYANAFEHNSNSGEANDGLSTLRKDTDPAGYLLWAQEWIAEGASMVGGCCGIGPENIAALAQALK